MGEAEMPQQGQSVTIKYGKKQRQTVCYDFKPGSDGWCGVCIDGAEPFTYGFCAPGTTASPVVSSTGFLTLSKGHQKLFFPLCNV